MNEQPFNNSLVIVGVVFGVLLMGMYILEVVQPVGRQAVGAATQPVNGNREGRVAVAKPPDARGELSEKEAALAAWDAFISRVKAACEKYNKDPENSPGDGKPANFVRFKGEDVKQSGSLRYAFEGELIVYEVFHFGKVYVEDIRWHFGWKGGRWEYKDATSQRIQTPGGPTDPSQLDDSPRMVADKVLEGEKKRLVLNCLE